MTQSWYEYLTGYSTTTALPPVQLNDFLAWEWARPTNPMFELNQWINEEILFPRSIAESLTTSLGAKPAHYLLCYIRDLFAGSLLYYLVGACWHFTIYRVYGKRIFTDTGRKFPSTAVILDQIQLAQASLFIYAALPVLSEWLIEEGHTQVYWSVSEIGGWGNYLALTILYFALVEIGIYWMHRSLHTVKWLYTHVHGLHHKYNVEEHMTPWCSIAFNPIDGVLQASPYVVGMFLVPCHYLTHIALLFLTAVWATNIHDAVDFECWPIMGAKYHTRHHTHYHVNFGQVFVFCDWYWGTLQEGRPQPKKALATGFTPMDPKKLRVWKGKSDEAYAARAHSRENSDTSGMGDGMDAKAA